MKLKLYNWLQCPWCGGSFSVDAYKGTLDSDVEEGLLTCNCGRAFPIVRGIPRILEDAFALHADFTRRYADRLPTSLPKPAAPAPDEDAIRRTRESFGYQWTTFSEMVIDFRENFLNYIEPVDEKFFAGKVGMDMGCGFGRHIYNAAKFGADMVGVDISDAIESTRVNTAGMPNVHLVQANVYALPFKPGVFDFAYSIGVLHHLPDPEKAFQCIVDLVKPRGSVFVWVYSNSRTVTNFFLETARAVTTRVPPKGQQAISLAAAVVDYYGFILPYKALSRLPGIGGAVRKMRLPRLRLYGTYPFQVTYADWFDRLAAPIRFYYDGPQMQGWLERANLKARAVSPTGLFGWRAYGERS